MGVLMPALLGPGKDTHKEQLHSVGNGRGIPTPGGLGVGWAPPSQLHIGAKKGLRLAVTISENRLSEIARGEELFLPL